MATAVKHVQQSDVWWIFLLEGIAAIIFGILLLTNPAATLLALAVFALIPFVGAVLGLIAFVLGIFGLRVAHRNPAAGGKVHAWIGIILGGLCGFGYLALIIFAFSAIARGR
jgi:uncharacterized membrane protein HdeD (DUF308 family)